jgi:hypothetical protein
MRHRVSRIRRDWTSYIADPGKHPRTREYRTIRISALRQ